MTKVAIIDSGCANLNSIYKASLAAGLEPQVTGEPRKILNADAIIFPGVGSFSHAVKSIDSKGLRDTLLMVIERNKPFLGICLGMQLLFGASEESIMSSSADRGFGIMRGTVKRFPENLVVPHVGWNQAVTKYPHPLFRGLENDTYFYFTHSYYVETLDDDNILCETDYSISFTSAVIKNNILGVQFHPEKSGSAGLRLLSNFGKIIADQQ